MGMIDKKQASLIAGLGAGAAVMLFTDAGRAARKRVQSKLPEKAPETNHQLAARVCVELDHRVDHPKGIQVFADDDRVILRGVALRDELDDVLAITGETPGVTIVSNQLEVRDEPGKVFALQE